MSIGKSILVWIMTGLIAVAAFFCNIFGLTPPTMPDCLTEPTTAIVTTVTTTTTTTTKAPQTFTVDATIIQNFITSNPESFVEGQVCSLQPTPPSGSTTVDDRVYIVDGVILIDLLEHLGADIAAINPGSILTIMPSDGPAYAADYNYARITARTTLISLAYTDYTDAPHKPGDVPRSFIITGPNGLAVKTVSSLTLKYN